MNADMPNHRPVLHKLHPLRLIYAFDALQPAPPVPPGCERSKRQRGEAFGGDTLQEGNP